MTRPGARADLLWLAQRIPDLEELRLRGTSRHWRQTSSLDPTAREQADEHARLERAERTADAIGEHPAPLHVDTLDLLLDLTTTARQLAEAVCSAVGIDRVDPAPPASLLKLTVVWYDTAATSAPDVAEWVTGQAARLRSEVAVAVGEVLDGQTIQAHCPWCHGGTSRAYTLRVRHRQGEAWVVCESGVCEPSSADCGTWFGGRPAWSVTREGTWLADHIAHAEGQAA